MLLFALHCCCHVVHVCTYALASRLLLLCVCLCLKALRGFYYFQPNLCGAFNDTLKCRRQRQRQPREVSTLCFPHSNAITLTHTCTFEQYRIFSLPVLLLLSLTQSYSLSLSLSLLFAKNPNVIIAYLLVLNGNYTPTHTQMHILLMISLYFSLSFILTTNCIFR